MSKATYTDILLWLALAAMWSSSYTVIKIGVAVMDPSVLVLGRMLIGSIVVYGAMKLRRLSLSREPAHWMSYTVTGLLGSALPFLLITYGELSVDSALASILIGIVPVATLVLAALLIADEALTVRRSVAVLGGFAGVAILVGPAAFSGLGGELLGQIAILGAALCYAASTVYIRRFVKRPALEMATGSMIVGTFFIGCFVVLSGAKITDVQMDLPSLGTVLYLGVFSTACANLIYFYLVPRLGATRMSQVNYAVPVGGAVLGAVLLGEAITTNRFAALFVIVAAVYVGTSPDRSPRTTPSISK